MNTDRDTDRLRAENRWLSIGLSEAEQLEAQNYGLRVMLGIGDRPVKPQAAPTDPA
jgi:hypothetical protein